jgi:hypothetical protein
VLKATRNFWRQLVRKDVLFSNLTTSFASMEAAEKKADSIFKMASQPAALQQRALSMRSMRCMQ